MIYYKKNVSSVRREHTRAKKDDLSVTNALREHGLLEKTPRTSHLVEVKKKKKRKFSQIQKMVLDV